MHTPLWTVLRTTVCSYPIDVFQLSFNFLCLLLLYSIYLNGTNCAGGANGRPHGHHEQQHGGLAQGEAHKHHRPSQPGNSLTIVCIFFNKGLTRETMFGWSNVEMKMPYSVSMRNLVCFGKISRNFVFANMFMFNIQTFRFSQKNVRKSLIFSVFRDNFV